MNGSMYQKVFEACKDVGSARRNKLLKIYLHIPSLPALRATRASLTELKGKSERRDGRHVRSPREK